MSQAWHIELKSQGESLNQVMTWIHEFCVEHAPAKEFEYKIQITVEELIINIITHGYGTCHRNGKIWLTLYPQSEGVAMSIEDEAPPFNPLIDSQPPDTDASIDDRPIGGLGIKFVQELADRAFYTRTLRNSLVLVFGPGSLPKNLNAEQEKNKRSIPKDAHDKTPNTAEAAPGWYLGRMTIQVLAILILLLIISIAAAGALNILKFERVFNATMASRYDPVALELGRSIGASLEDGLSLASIQTTQHLIDRSVAQFDGVFDLAVENLDGEILFTTKTLGQDYHDLNEVSPPPRPGQIRHIFGPDSLVVARVVILQGKDPVGVLSLTHAIVPRVATYGLPHSILHAGILSMLVVLPFLILAALIMFGQIEGRFHSRKRAIERVTTGAGSCPAGSDLLVKAVWRLAQYRKEASPIQNTKDRLG